MSRERSDRARTGLEIAVVGLAGRFPGAADTEAFWRNLANGVESVRFFRPEELLAAGTPPEILEREDFVPARAVLDDVEQFDASLFGFTPLEASVLDPQHRLFLEAAWQSLEDAGQAPDAFPGSIGIYAGVGESAYFLRRIWGRPEIERMLGAFQAAVSHERDFFTTRVSYKLGLDGPSVTVQSACSTSLVAVHLACQALLAGECDLALAGGASLQIPQVSGYFYQAGGIASPDGHCRAFDERAGGTVSGDGVGVVVLRRLDDALEDGDRIRAILLASAVNNDGPDRAGYTAPSVEGQAKVIRAALAAGEVRAETVGYVEAHGAATPLGDPTEVAALTRAFASTTENVLPPGSCAIGSVKTNIGHLGPAAGVAGLIKTVLALENHQIPPSLHYRRPNPQIDFSTSPFYVNAQHSEWPANGGPRRAGVSSFGLGGTNAHVILEEAPDDALPSGPSRSHQVLLLSAHTSSALDTATDQLATHLRQHPEQSLADVAHSLRRGRRTLRHRRVLVVRSTEDAPALLETRNPSQVREATETERNRPVVFLLAGVGEQYAGMVHRVYPQEPVFRRNLDRCCEILRPRLGIDLRPLLTEALEPASQVTSSAEGPDFRRLLGRGATPEAGVRGRLDRTLYAQPAMFAVNYALAQTWMSWGIVPRAMIGYSLGEYLAACLSGALELDDALHLVAERARLIDGLPAGVMLAVPLAEAEVLPHLGDDLAVAAVNAPFLSVVGGPEDAVARLEEHLAKEGVAARRLRTTHAFHSPMMAPIAERFAAVAAEVQTATPRIPYVSNVTGTWVRTEDLADPGYWVRHLLGTVRFSQGLGEILEEPDSVLLEIGPGRNLGTFVRQHPGGDRPLVSSLPPRDEAGEDSAYLLDALGRLWLAGPQPDWRGFVAHERRRIVPLPGYPFERQRFWLESDGHAPQPVPSAPEPAPAATPFSAESDTRPKQTTPSFPRPALPTPYVEPTEPLEAAVAGIWQELLGLDRVGRHDSFFELGGHSLLATQVVARLWDDLGVEVPLRTLSEAPTPTELAEVVRRRRETGPAEEHAGLPAVVPNPESLHEPFPLTDVQQAYWVGRGASLDLGNVATHVYIEKQVPDLDVGRYEEAWRRLIDRHGMLRAVFLPEGRQKILARVPPYEIRRYDLRGRSAEEVERTLEEIRREMSHQVLPAETWPLFDMRASLLDGNRVRLHLSYDLLISDDWSFKILSDELEVLEEDPDATLPPLEISFRDYVMMEQTLRDGELYRRSQEYWQARLDQLPPAPELPLAVDPENIEKPRFVSYRDWMEREPWSRLKKAAQQRGLTPTALLLACFGEVLATWSRHPRLTLNLTLFNRLPVHPQIESLVGDFSSLTLLAIDPGTGRTFEERARQVQARLWEDLDHRYFSGVRVMRELARTRGSLSGAMMPVVMTSTVNLDPNTEEPQHEVDPGQYVYSISQTPQVWIDHQVTELGGRLRFNWDVVEDLFPPGLLDDLFGAFRRLIHRLADAPESWEAKHFDLLPEIQRDARAAANDTAGPLPDELLHRGFERRAAETPEAIAWIEGDQSITYGELDRASARLGATLREAGVKPDELVAVVLPKGWRQAVAVLAVLRSGAAYLPVDAALPAQRRRLLLDHGRVSHALTDPPGDRDLVWPDGVTRYRIEEDLLAEEGRVPHLAPAQGSESLAYVVYTSGSTGQPKGVMIEHRAAANTLADMVDRFDLGPRDRVLALSSLSFDLSVFDLFGIWTAGGAAVLPATESPRDPAAWAKAVARHRVTIWNSVPALLQMLVDYTEGQPGPDLSSLRLVLLSGDWIPVDLPSRLRRLAGAEVEDPPQLVSLGGATEAAIWSICHPTEGAEEGWPSIPYGRPLRNQRFHILDDELRERPDWVPGQLYIAGAGLAQGYWRDPARTAESFVIHPETGERLYRTGDLGRWRPGGVIEFLGREDFQVKIQGHRIELGEVEATLATHPRVATAVAMAVGQEHGSKRLVAYVVPTGNPEEGLKEALEEWLAAKLPAYMVPAAIVLLDRLPLTANGKVDRKALPEPGAPQRREASGDTGDARARQIRAVVEEILEVDAVSSENNLLELGATSIEIIQLATRLHQELGVHPELEELFTLPDVAALVRWYEQRSPEADAGSIPEIVETPEDRFSRWYEVIHDPDARDRFKERQPGLRPWPQEAETVPLPTLADEAPIRGSIRRYAAAPLAGDALGRLLGHLAQVPRGNGTEPRHNYASAGGLYPLQTYVEIKPGRVEGIPPGLWYHDPVEQKLVAVTPGAELDERIHGWINRTIYEQAAFSLYLVADIAAIGPMYGPIGKDYCWMEAGLMSQLLETAAPDLGIGLCQIGIGGVDVETIRPLLELEANHLVVHCLLGGPLDPNLGTEARKAVPYGADPAATSPAETEEAWEEGEF